MKLNQQYIEKIFREVAKSFPELKESEVKIEYCPYQNKAAGYVPLNVKETKKEPKISIGKNFSNYTSGTQKGIIAHEIGHYQTLKHWTIPRIKRHNKWIRMFNRNHTPYARLHWKQKLKQIYLLSEMAADNKAAKTPYGKNNLQNYRKQISQYKQFSEEKKKLNKKMYENLQILAKNLEEKLILK